MRQGGNEEEEKDVREVKEGRNKEPTTMQRAKGLLQSKSTFQRMHFSNQTRVSTQEKLHFGVWRNNAVCICGEWKPTLYRVITRCHTLSHAFTTTFMTCRFGGS